MRPSAWLLLGILAAAVAAPSLPGRSAPAPAAPGDRMLARYFQAETADLAARSLGEVRSLADWTRLRDAWRRQLFEMYGLDPLPERTNLKAQITGRVEHPEFTVEKLHFQSRPGLYVTANLYLPKGVRGRAPAILYACGHGNVKQNGISYGAKAFYQHHGAWLARNGYVCLVLDTLQLGEIEGLHHGTYREGMWWWNSRGYTPAGVEAWNGIRALDYLRSRPEVDPERIGMTGRSGGGAYTWSVAALDERVRVAVPVAGITDIQNHVVDGAVEGHCDCMFPVNTYRWDFSRLAALVAPRPLLIANTDKDPIFPLDGVVRLHAAVRRIYDLHGAGDRLGLLITEGPHQDTQELQLPALRWFDRFLKGEVRPIETAAAKLFTPEQLRVFRELPADQRNTRIHEQFVPPAALQGEPSPSQREALLAALREKTFGGWPERPEPLAAKPAFSVEREGLRLAAIDFVSQREVPLRLYLAHRAGLRRPKTVRLMVLDEAGWRRWLAGMRHAFAEELAGAGTEAVRADAAAFAAARQELRATPEAMAWIAPRGIGPTAWSGDARKQVQIRRRFMLLGQTLAGMRVWDVRRAVQALRALPDAGLRGAALRLGGDGEMAVIALYAALFEPDVAGLDLRRLPDSHREGPDFLNVLRILDLPQAVALARARISVHILPAAGEP